MKNPLLYLLFLLLSCSSPKNEETFIAGSQLDLLSSLDVGSIPSIMFENNIDTIYGVNSTEWRYVQGDTISVYVKTQADSIKYQGQYNSKLFVNANNKIQLIYSGSCMLIEKPISKFRNLVKDTIFIGEPTKFKEDTIFTGYIIKNNQITEYVRGQFSNTFYSYKKRQLTLKKEIRKIKHDHVDSVITEYQYEKDSIKSVIENTYRFSGCRINTIINKYKDGMPYSETRFKDSVLTSELLYDYVYNK